MFVIIKSWLLDSLNKTLIPFRGWLQWESRIFSAAHSMTGEWMGFSPDLAASQLSRSFNLFCMSEEKHSCSVWHVFPIGLTSGEEFHIHTWEHQTSISKCLLIYTKFLKLTAGLFFTIKEINPYSVDFAGQTEWWLFFFSFSEICILGIFQRENYWA